VIESPSVTIALARSGAADFNAGEEVKDWVVVAGKTIAPVKSPEVEI